MLCSVDGCDRASQTRGMCRRHYNKKRRYGNPLATCGGKDPIALTHPHLVCELVNKQDGMLTKGSSVKVMWRCPAGHTYKSAVCSRAIHGTGCFQCNSPFTLKPGINDIATRAPQIAGEFLGDPSAVHAGTRKKYGWCCSVCRFVWKASPDTRAREGTGCPACAGMVVREGINDMQTVRPDLAKELLDKTLATKITGCSSRIVPSWVCSTCSHVYKCRVSNRARGVGCPECIPHGGFSKKYTRAWLYLLHRDGQQKVGITGQVKRRIKDTHSKNGWQCIDIRLVNAADAEAIESQCLYVLDALGVPRGAQAFRDKFEGYSESWQTVDWWADSLDCFTRKLYSDVWDKVFSVC